MTNDCDCSYVFVYKHITVVLNRDAYKTQQFAMHYCSIFSSFILMTAVKSSELSV